MKGTVGKVRIYLTLQVIKCGPKTVPCCHSYDTNRKLRRHNDYNRMAQQFSKHAPGEHWCCKLDLGVLPLKFQYWHFSSKFLDKIKLMYRNFSIFTFFMQPVTQNLPF
jgi:hypothetical protein